MTTRPEHEQPDWLIPLVLVAVGLVFGVALAAFFAVRSNPSGDENLADEMESWTRCLRAEGAPVPLVEAVRGGGFRVTFDEAVLDSEFDFGSFAAALDVCVDDAPDGIRTATEMIRGFTSFGRTGGMLDMLGPLLFDFMDSDMLGGPDSGFPPMGEPGLDELCAQLDDLELIVPDVARELRDLCPTGDGV